MRIEHSVMINRPIEEVCAFVVDAKKLPQWTPAVIQAKQTSEGPVDVGSMYHLQAQFLGRRMDSTSEVTAYEPNKYISFRTTSGPIPMEAQYTFDSVDSGTRVTEVIEAEPGGFFKLAEPVLRRMAQRQMETSLDNLKDLLEART